MKKIALAFLIKTDDRVYHNMAIFRQFTIDFIESFRSDLEESVENEPDGYINESEEKSFLQAMAYNVSTIIEICREGADKELFEELYKFLDELAG